MWNQCAHEEIEFKKHLYHEISKIAYLNFQLEVDRVNPFRQSLPPFSRFRPWQSVYFSTNIEVLTFGSIPNQPSQTPVFATLASFLWHFRFDE